jgi:hypothetical protein
MPIFRKTTVLDSVAYAELVKDLVDNHNEIVDLLNLTSNNQSTGASLVGEVNLLIDSVATPITTNIVTGLGGVGTVLEIEIKNWAFYFSAVRSLIQVISSTVTLSGTKGFIYVNEDGELLITSAPYSTYQPDRVRLLYFNINQDNEVSIVVLPEMAATPRYLRSISLNQKLLQVVDFNIQPSGLLTFRRFSTRALIEGSGSLSILDENILNLPDEETVRLLDENDNIEYNELDTGTAGTVFATKQLWLTIDGKLVVQPSTFEYQSIEEAANELPYEFYPAINGDNLGEYVPVARIAHLQGATDLNDATEAYILNLTKVFEPRQGLVWYTK